jgi:predicted Zn-dependent protease
MMIFTGTLSGCASGKIWPESGNTWSYDEETEIEQGKEQHSRILKQAGEYSNPKLSEYVSRVGTKVATVSDRPKLQWHFTVIDSAMPTAFATEGGYVYITRGMLALLQTDAELAAILSHEIAHICARDVPQSRQTGNLMGLGVLGILVLNPALILFPQIAAAPAGAGMAALSRKDELNADRLGAEYLQRAGFPPESMQTVLQILESMSAYERTQQQSQGGAASQWWHRMYASHPTTGERREQISDVAGEQPTNHATPQPEFLACLNGLEFGSSKHQGIVHGRKRYFADLHLAIEVPEDWIAQLTPKRDRIWLVRRDGKAYIQIEQTASIDINEPCNWLGSKVSPSSLTDAKPIHKHELPSCSGLARKQNRSLFGRKENMFRAGVITNSKDTGLGYVFYGHAEQTNFAETDPVFLQIAEGIEHMQDNSKIPNPPALRVRRAKAGESFAYLARNSRIMGKDTESTLRLLNRHYPSGEPEPGELIKIIE